MERSAKARRLEGLRRELPYVSYNAMASLLNRVAAEGVPETMSRWTIHRAAEELIKEQTQHGSITVQCDMVLTSGGTMPVTFVNPITLLHMGFKQKGWGECMLRSIAQHPPTPSQPWNLILYSDEVVPGNPLGMASRKLWIVYASFLELGPKLLSSEYAWIPLFLARSSLVSTLSGGMSQVFSMILKLLFGQAGPMEDLSREGMHIPNTHSRLFCRLGMFLQDGAAHKYLWGCKGDAGTKLCMLCRTTLYIYINSAYL